MDLTAEISERHVTLDLDGVERRQRPAVVTDIENLLNELLALNDRWDGHRARRVTIEATTTVVDVLAALMNLRSAPAQIFPLPDGGLQVDWLVGGNSIEVDIDAAGDAHLLATTSDETIVDEGPIDPHKPEAQLLTARRYLQTLSE